MSIANLAARRHVESIMLGTGAVTIAIVTAYIAHRSDALLTSVARHPSDNWLGTARQLSDALVAPVMAFGAMPGSEIAGSIASIMSYTCLLALIYKAARRLASQYSAKFQRIAALGAVCAFSVNPVTPHLHSGLTVAAFRYAALLGATYSMCIWATDTTRRNHLVVSATWLMLATLSGRDTWPVAGIFVLLVGSQSWRSSPFSAVRLRCRTVQDATIVYASISLAGIVSYMALATLMPGMVVRWGLADIVRPTIRNAGTDVGQGLIAFRNLVLENLPQVIVGTVVAAGIGYVLHHLKPLAKKYRRGIPAFLAALCPLFVLIFFVDTGLGYVDRIGSTVVDLRFDLLPIIPASILAGHLLGRAATFLTGLSQNNMRAQIVSFVLRKSLRPRESQQG